jgi:Potential Queuosine, Q, salvage protein family
VACFRDLNRLTMFADNLVPHVLRLDGILRFDPELVARIDREELIAHGSAEEVEIRACAVHAVELLVTAVPGSGLSAAALDQVLWHRGQQPRYKAAARHRSRCTAY